MLAGEKALRQLRVQRFSPGLGIEDDGVFARHVHSLGLAVRNRTCRLSKMSDLHYHPLVAVALLLGLDIA
jgi:hypothetical protein